MVKFWQELSEKRSHDVIGNVNIRKPLATVGTEWAANSNRPPISLNFRDIWPQSCGQTNKKAHIQNSVRSDNKGRLMLGDREPVIAGNFAGVYVELGHSYPHEIFTQC